MSIFLMAAVFILGYVFIAMEHKTGIDKAGIALVTSGILWVIYIFSAGAIIPVASPEEFAVFLSANPDLAHHSYLEQCTRFVTDHQIIEQLGETAEVLLFLIGAMTIVDLIDIHGGFNFITVRITTRNKTKLLWIIAFITFFMSALLDNMTSTIVMVMLLRKLIANYKERWVFASLIVISANSGGAWSPIGDVTTIMLWVKGNISALPIVKALILPCIVSLIIPSIIASRILHGILRSPDYKDDFEKRPVGITKKESMRILMVGVVLLVSVPVFKSVTHLPPYMGVMTALGLMWIYTELMYKRKKDIEESIKNRVAKVLKHIDMPTILFFLGILMSVAALQSAGILNSLAGFLDEKTHNIYAINTMIGIMSSIVDNVPLVAAATGMYPIVDAAAVASAADPAYMAYFVQDGIFWHLLAYCAGVGGSILIIGSAAGVVAMGLEKINFMWYLRNISLMAFAGYLAGIGVYLLQVWLGLF